MDATADLERTVVDRLVAAGCVAAREEAAELTAAAPDAERLDAMLRRRERGEPLPWITGSIAFAGRRVHVAPGVYVPRFQTEVLAERAASVLAAGGRAVDLCTGSGAIAAHLLAAVPGATVVGVDHDPRAVRCARANGVSVVRADLTAPGGLPLARRSVDVVTAVAPYVPSAQVALLPPDVVRHEPRLALDGGDDGLDLVRAVVAAAAELLRAGGWLLVEVGGEQDDALAPTLAQHDFAPVEPWFDDEGDLRGLAARRR